MNGTGKVSAAQAIANLVGDVVHKVILSTSQHTHSERTRHTVGVLQEMADGAQAAVGPVMAHVLDTGKVHPVLEPVVRQLAGRQPPEA